MRHSLIANVALVREGFQRLHIRDVPPHLLLTDSKAVREISGCSRDVARNAVPHFLQTLLTPAQFSGLPTHFKETVRLCNWVVRGAGKGYPLHCD